MKKIILSILLVLLLFYFIIQPFYFNLSPTTGDEPSYEPKKWNSNPNIKNSHNCYTYMLDDINPYGQKICDTYGIKKCKLISKPIPGHYTGNTQHTSTCDTIMRGMMMDNPDIYKIDFNSPCKKGYYKGALVVDPFLTYHFFRQDNNSYWSQKNGHDNATNRDGDGYLITDPKYAKPTYDVSNRYNLCDFFCVPSNKHKKTNTARLEKKSNKHYYRN
jgi:hypothetical protein